MVETTVKPSSSTSKGSFPGQDIVVDSVEKTQEKKRDEDGGPEGGVEVTARPSPPLPEEPHQDKPQAADEGQRDQYR